MDVGGTFTDLVALTPDGTIEVRKVATTPEDPALGMFRALDTLGTRDEGRGTSAATSPPVPRPSSPVPIDMLIHGTTIATNALLERRRIARRCTTWHATTRHRSWSGKTWWGLRSAWGPPACSSRSRTGRWRV